MRKRYLQWFLGGISLFVIVGVCRVAYPKGAPAATETSQEPAKPSPWSPVEAVGLADPLKNYGLEIHGLLAANYTYNFNEPHSGKNGLLLMNRKSDHFDL